MQTGKVTGYVLILCLVLIGCAFLAGCTRKGPDAGSMNESSIVTTDVGSVSGLSMDGLRVYLGIPYAASPTGDLRWRPPAPVQPWNGTKVATRFSAACPQPATADPSAGDIPANMSEDCLYLNVWTPARNADEKLPVMVFIHGGAFGQGSGSSPMYNGTALAKRGVVVVTLNYRLGALGFFAHPDLANESLHHTSGNYGLLDQRAALVWVQRNIGTFGGDPSRVTLFGESAGASSILMHLVSPESTGLYRQAIIQSGPLWTNGTTVKIVASREDAERWGLEYARLLGYGGPDAIRQMRRVSAQELVNATPWQASSFWLTYLLKFKPTIDGWLIPDSPDTLFYFHHQNPVPLIIGTNSDEGTLLAANANMTVPEYERFIRARFGNEADAVLARYPASSTEEVQYRLERIMTDYDFSDAAKWVAGSMADINQSTYLYRFTYAMPGQPMGVFHGSELFFVFRPPAMKPDPVSGSVSDTMMDFWVRFAKTGDPNGGMNVSWSKYTRKEGMYLDIGEVPVMKRGY